MRTHGWKRALSWTDAIGTRLLVAVVPVLLNLATGLLWVLGSAVHNPSEFTPATIAAQDFEFMSYLTLGCAVAAFLIPGAVLVGARVVSPAARRIGALAFIAASTGSSALGVAVFGCAGFWLAQPLLNHAAGEFGLLLWGGVTALGTLALGTLGGLLGTLSRGASIGVRLET